MAITIIKEPSGVYPAYNNSYLSFTSSLADNNRAEITIYPTSIFTRVFTIYPDVDGVYLFNFKEAVKVIFNECGFVDQNFFDDSYFKSISGLYLNQQIQAKVYSDVDVETQDFFYKFYKAVKQIGESIHDNDFEVLTYTSDGITHNLTYFEGFPYHFDIKLVEAGKILKVKNLNNDLEVDNINVSSTGAFRMNVDRSESLNWTDDNILPLIDGFNKLEIYEDDVFKCNVNIYKKYKCKGVYLKWQNRSGGFSHFLFDQYYRIDDKSKNIGVIDNSSFDNVDDNIGAYNSTGKDGESKIQLKTRYSQYEYEVLKDLIYSPFIQMYSSESARIKGKYINVDIEGTFRHSNKKEFNELSITVDMQKVNAVTL